MGNQSKQLASSSPFSLPVKTLVAISTFSLLIYSLKKNQKSGQNNPISSSLLALIEKTKDGAQKFQGQLNQTTALTASAISILLLFSSVWGFSVFIRDVSIIDSFWSLGYLVAAIVYYYHPETQNGSPERKKLILTLMGLWGVRLSAYLTWRNHGIGEDYRYVGLRKMIGDQYWWKSYFYTFLPQWFLCWFISHPLLSAQKRGLPFGTKSDLIGSLVWLVGFFFETVSDFQLATFKSNPANKGKLLTEGLWKFSRHPNYFGNATMFWGIYIISLSCKKGLLDILKDIHSPLLMNYLLLRVSGVALLEKSLKKRKPEYADYISRTNAFLPFFPSSSSSKDL
eukprot:TRINITY_DN9312_c0_g1_i1.p1 TRINITY_DN9312_c0_g1~~TRINITY_DN9312_c0_g1_i1.p1  ORF type:complete len:340 (+),score=78.98 TRINITY_DN9312_c0_g1_i1:49-1068(+)